MNDVDKCHGCGKKCPSHYEVEICDSCGTGILATNDEDFIDWMDEPGHFQD